MKIPTSRSATRAALFCSAACLLASPALAQTAPAADPTEEAQTGGLQDIVVTARKRVENLQNIPVADQVISAKQIDNYQINSIEKVSVLAPQLIVGRNGTGNGAAIGLRGISVNATSISLEQSVATVIDGVYYSGGRALNIGLFDVGQVELLKGPQSLFYGKNTTAGAISIGTADPTRDFQAMLRTGYEFKGKQVFEEGFVSGPITDTLSLRVAGRVSKQFGSLIENTAYGVTTYTKDIATGTVTPHYTPPGKPNLPGEESATGRIGLKFASGGFTAVFKNTYNYYHTNAANSASVIGECESGLVQTDPTAPCGHVFKVANGAIPADIAAVNPYENRHGGQNYLDYYMFNSTLNLTYETDKVTFSLVPAYTVYTDYWVTDSDFTSLYLNRAPALGTGGNNAATREQQKASSVEFRAQTHLGGMFNVMAGGYYQHSELTFAQENLFPGGVENSAVTDPSLRYLTIRKRGFTNGDTYSVFGQVLLDITPTLNITGGVRYSHEKKDSMLSQPYVFPGSTASYKQTSISPPGGQTFDNTSPEATVTWKPQSNITVYGSYRTGYKSGGFSISGTISPTTTYDNAAFGPEKVHGFEGGVKTTLFDRQVRLNAGAFSYIYTGLQVDFLNTITIQYLTLNAAAARTRGIELEAEFAPNAVPGLHLRSSAAFTDAKYTSFPLAPCLGGQTPLEGCSLAVNGAGAGTRQDLSGQTTPQAPKFAGTLGVDYDTPISNNWKIGLSSNLRYSGRYKTYAFAPDAADRFHQDPYATIDASIRLMTADDKWEIALIGKNLTNHFVQSSAFDLTYTGARTGLATGLHADTRSTIYDPRTVAVQATVRF
ncbi:MAG: TonB-dependent receptor [Sphingomonas bacterium]|uniref:TonB-dependent receptor n=1 Tax=Sphingomonas bacterium TaxID=1895847 RepID=UPI00261976CB|nr:TonB-dependent receptor [Sphingomonas bacterium]MDB5704749.1 TonB-dependent receptor [Sphingomonas bacterium]